LFALVNLAMADAGISAWDCKYVDNFWRPITAIRAGARDGNPLTVGLPTWTPLGAPRSNAPGETNFTPPFPAYTSGHATFGAALSRTLALFYGTDRIPFSFTSDEFNGVTRDQSGAVRPVVTRHWNSFSQAMAENAQSRIYLGIHWHFDAVQGIAGGKAIGDWVFTHELRPVGSGSAASVVSALLPGATGGSTTNVTLPPQVPASLTRFVVTAVPSVFVQSNATSSGALRGDSGGAGALLRAGDVLSQLFSTAGLTGQLWAMLQPS